MIKRIVQPANSSPLVWLFITILKSEILSSRLIRYTAFASDSELPSIICRQFFSDTRKTPVMSFSLLYTLVELYNAISFVEESSSPLGPTIVLIHAILFMGLFLCAPIGFDSSETIRNLTIFLCVTISVCSDAYNKSRRYFLMLSALCLVLRNARMRTNTHSLRVGAVICRICDARL